MQSAAQPAGTQQLGIGDGRAVRSTWTAASVAAPINWAAAVLFLMCLQTLQRAYDRAVGLELQHMRERKHVFKKARPAGGSAKEHRPGSSREEKGNSSVGAHALQGEKGSRKQQKSKLSFADDEEEEP
jgi:hypothetical protein